MNTRTTLTLALLLFASSASAQTTAFTYQGHLMDGGASANGNYDIEFRLMDADTAGADVSTPQVVAPVNVVNGIFTVSLNFGQGPYSGSDRWVEMSVRPFGSAAARTVLAPRQKLTSAPYAVRSFISTNAQSLIGSISGSNIPAGTITGSMIAPGAISSGLIAPGTVNPAIGVNSASQTAAAGTVYNANHFDLSTFNLPASATIGEVIEINGVGSGGWSTAAAWVPRDSNRSWTSIASSADGQRLVATVTGGQIYTSDTQGVLWTPRDASRNWQDVASSDDGSKLVATVYGSTIYTSADYGATWTQRPGSGSRNWEAVASSADGARLIAATLDFTTGKVFTSADSGATWTESTGAGVRPWKGVASSADGMRLVAVVGSFGGGQIYTSQDGGATWTARESVRDWFSVACSADGAFIAAAPFGGQIRVSSNGGANWSAVGPDLTWKSIDCSADGRVIIACENSGLIYVSVDHGNVWTAQESGRFWDDITCSADGSRRAACVFTGQIYTSNGGFSGAGGTSTRLQYAGAGIWNQVVDASESAKVSRSGDTMTGQLNLPANGLSVGGSQLVTSGGLTSIGVAAPEPGFALTLGGTPLLGSLDGLLMLRDHNGANQWDSLLNSADGNLFLVKVGGGFSHGFLANGNVGVSTDTPIDRLHVAGGGMRLESTGNSLAYALANGGTVTGELALPVALGHYSNDAVAGDVVLRNSVGGKLLLQTGAGASALSINASNNVGVGMISTANRLEVNGNASKTTAGSWLANSDRRIKEDIQPIGGALDTLSKVRLVDFRYTADYRAAHPGIADQRYLNVVAQEFAEVFPDHVRSSGETLPDGSPILQVDTYPLTIYSAAAVQELNAKLKAKEEEIAGMKARLERLEKLMEKGGGR